MPDARDTITEDEARQVIQGSEHTFLDALAAYGFARTHAPLIYHVVNALAGVSSVMSTDVMIRGLAGRRVPAVLMAIVSGDAQQACKTTALGYLEDALSAICPERLIGNPDTEAALFTQLLAHTEAEGSTKVSRGTVIMGEMGTYLKKLSKDTHTATMKVRLLELADCARMTHVLKKENQCVQNPRWTWIAGVNPALIVENTSTEDWHGGLMARFLVLLAQRERNYDHTEEHPELWEPVVERLESLANVSFGDCVGFSGKAQTAWASWVKDLMVQSAACTDPGVASALGRAPVHAAKAAVLLAINDGKAAMRSPDGTGGSWKLREDQVARGIRLAQLGVESFATLSSMAVGDQDMRDRATVLRVLKRLTDGGAKYALYGTAMEESQMLKRKFDGILETLIEQDRAERRQGQAGKMLVRYMDKEKETEDERDSVLSPGASNLVELSRARAREG